MRKTTIITSHGRYSGRGWTWNAAFKRAKKVYELAKKKDEEVWAVTNDA